LSDDEDLSGTHIHLVLMRAQRAVGAHAKASFAAMDLGFSDFRILEALLHKGPQLVNDIGRRIDLTSGSITSAVDRLEARGLVERTADARDARARIVLLTREGKALITKAFAAHKKRLDAIAGPLSKAERQQLLALLKKLGRHAEATKPNTE
jgi:MarR family transcriptional regulator, 2-MHQ and catechol-resistance regulon repressor